MRGFVLEQGDPENGVRTSSWRRVQPYFFRVAVWFQGSHFGTKVVLTCLGVDSPFFIAIVLFKNQPFPQGVWWFSRRIPGKNGEGTPRT